MVVLIFKSSPCIIWLDYLDDLELVINANQPMISMMNAQRGVKPSLRLTDSLHSS